MERRQEQLVLPPVVPPEWRLSLFEWNDDVPSGDGNPIARPPHLEPGPLVMAIEYRVSHPDRLTVVGDGQGRPSRAAGVPGAQRAARCRTRAQIVEVPADVVAREQRN